MSENKDDPIRALIKEKKNRSKIGQIRELMPSIQYAHAGGVTLERIVEELRVMGIDVTYGYLRTILHRIRKEPTGKKRKQNSFVVNPATIGTNKNQDDSISAKKEKIKEINEEELTSKQRREKIADLFVNENKISPRLQRLLEKQNENSSD